MEDKTYVGYSWLDDEDNEFKICIVHFDIQLYFILLRLMAKKFPMFLFIIQIGSRYIHTIVSILFKSIFINRN